MTRQTSSVQFNTRHQAQREGAQGVQDKRIYLIPAAKIKDSGISYIREDLVRALLDAPLGVQARNDVRRALQGNPLIPMRAGRRA